MTDLTNTAPKRIYLDIGDQFALERVTSGDLRWDLLEGVTWSEDNATSHGIPYVRADLVPTPAASGAALPPFDPTDAMVNAMVRELLAGPRYEFWEDRAAAAWKAGYQAALPSQQAAASGAAPADSFEAWLDEFDDPQFPELRRRDRFGERVIEDFRIGWDAALASREATSAPVAPQDDARDAAKWRALPAYAERHQVNLVHLFRDIDDAMSLSTPAAKPTEEQA